MKDYLKIKKNVGNKLRLSSLLNMGNTFIKYINFINIEKSFLNEIKVNSLKF